MRNKLLGIIFFLSSNLGYAAAVSGSGDIVGNYQSISLTVVVTQIPINDPSIKTGSQQSDLFNNLSIYMSNNQNSPILTAAKNSSDSSSNIYFYWDQTTATAKIENDSATTQKITYTLTILPNVQVSPTKTLQDTDVGTTAGIPITAVINKYNASTGTYSAGSTQGLAQGTITVTKIYSSPNGAPGDLTISPDHKRLDLTWTTGDVPYLPATPAITRTPGTVDIFIFDGSAGPIDLEGAVASSTANPDSTACRYDRSGGANCIVCDDHPNDGYLNSTQSSPDVKVLTTPNTTGQYSVTDLTPGKEYVVVLQYDLGVKRTACMTGIPIETKTLTELNDPDNLQGDAKLGDPRCFIVSAAYGSAFDKHVDIFRWARDHYLNTTALGRKFVDFYYDHSQPFADSIRNSPKMKAVVRAFLKPVAFVLYKMKAQAESSTTPSRLIRQLEQENGGIGKPS